VKKYVLQSQGRKEYPTYNKKKERPTGFVTSAVGTNLKNTLFKQRSKKNYNGRKDEEENIGSYSLTLSKRENSGT